MIKNKIVNIILLLLILSGFFVYLHSQNIIAIERFPNNIFYFYKYPKAELLYLGTSANGDLNYTLKYKVPHPESARYTIYLAPIIKKQKHQDKWIPVDGLPIIESEGSVVLRLPRNEVLFNDYWLMVNVESSDGSINYNCMGNPTYNSLELLLLGLTSCGEKSHLKLFWDAEKNKYSILN